MGFGAEVDGFTIGGRGGHATVVELIGGNDFEFESGFDDEGFAFLIGKVEVSIGKDAGGREVCFEGGVAIDTAFVAIDAAKDTGFGGEVGLASDDDG